MTGFIRAFAGSNRYVLDYLVEEVLAHQPPEVEAFMLQTAVLERLCGPLCAAVLAAGRAADQAAPAPVERQAQAMLEHLEAVQPVPAADGRRAQVVPLSPPVCRSAAGAPGAAAAGRGRTIAEGGGCLV